uniref:Uncharacterized protein n=1 Tax=viral metagenome TaxID=1070528 RepID=A0A6H1ZJQ0_9ZZZZ
MAYDYETVMKALRKADATGNTEDAKRLAVIANKMKGSSKKEKHSDPMSFVNRGIASTIGAPVDLITTGLNLIPGVDIQEPVGGRKSLERLMGVGGVVLPKEGAEPSTISEHIGRGVGEVAGSVLPLGAGLKLLSKGAGLTGKISSNIYSSMTKRPLLNIASEITAGVGAGAGRGIAEEQEASPLKKSLSEMAGGVVGGAAPSIMLHTPTMLALRGGKNLLNKISVPFSEAGAKYRAGEYLKQTVKNPAEIAEKIGKKTISDLPPAIASGEKRLVSLYKSLTELDPAVDAKNIEDIGRSIIKLEKEMQKLGKASPEILVEMTKKRVLAIENSIDERILSATKKAQAKLESVPVAQRKVAESRIVRTELENAMREERSRVNAMWNDVPKDIDVGFDNTRKTFSDIRADLAQAQMEDIPDVLKNSPIIKNGKIKSTTLKEMQGLRSKLLESARAARKAGEWNKSRIAENVSDAIIADLGIVADVATTPDAAALKAALAGTKQFKNRFEQGITGKILGYSKSGAPAIDPDLTLDVSIGRMAQRGSVDIDKVVVTPEAMAATERYLGRSFTDYAIDKTTGKLNPIKSEQWIKNNESILDKFPGFKEKLSNSQEAQKTALTVKSNMDARKQALKNPKISASAKFLNSSDLSLMVDGILKDKDPLGYVNQIVRQANKDTTGEAIGGLRSAFIDNILEKSTVGPFNEIGEQTLSGRGILNHIEKNKRVMGAVFDQEQIQRMRKVGLELSKIESFEKTTAGKPDVELKDLASSALRMFARVGGARLGGWMGRESAGGSLQMAQIYSGAAQKFVTRLTRDRAAALVSDAVLSKDPSLLQSLLLPMDKPEAIKTAIKITNDRLNAWLAGTGKRVFEDILEEINTE